MSTEIGENNNLSLLPKSNRLNYVKKARYLIEN